MPGIIGTRIGHQEGSEIVAVEYDPEQVTLSEMVGALKGESSFYSVVASDRRAYEAITEELPDVSVTRARGEATLIESKHSLRTRFPELYYLDLTERQAIALNSWSYFGGEIPDVLSPGQIALRPELRRKIQRSGSPPFHPLRTGEGRQRYREKLMQWLGAP